MVLSVRNHVKVYDSFFKIFCSVLLFYYFYYDTFFNIKIIKKEAFFHSNSYIELNFIFLHIYFFVWDKKVIDTKNTAYTYNIHKTV